MKLEKINSIKISRNDFPFLQQYGNYCVDYIDEDGTVLTTITDDLGIILADIKDNFGEDNGKTR